MTTVDEISAITGMKNQRGMSYRIKKRAGKPKSVYRVTCMSGTAAFVERVDKPGGQTGSLEDHAVEVAVFRILAEDRYPVVAEIT